MAQSEITLQKLDTGGNDVGTAVTVYVIEIDDAFSSKLFLITPPQSKNNQSSGPKDSKIVDLLRITRILVITGEITGTSALTANQVKEDLIDIYTSTGQNGGLVKLSYDGVGRELTTSGAATTIKGIIEKVAFKENHADEPSSPPEDFAKFTVQMTFLEGIQIS